MPTVILGIDLGFTATRPQRPPRGLSDSPYASTLRFCRGAALEGPLALRYIDGNVRHAIQSISHQPRRN